MKCAFYFYLILLVYLFNLDQWSLGKGDKRTIQTILSKQKLNTKQHITSITSRINRYSKYTLYVMKRSMGLIHQYLPKFSLKYVLKKVSKKSLRRIHDVFLNSRIVRTCVLRIDESHVFVTESACQLFLISIRKRPKNSHIRT